MARSSAAVGRDGVRFMAGVVNVDAIGGASIHTEFGQWLNLNFQTRRHPERVKRVEGFRGIEDVRQTCLIVWREFDGILRSLRLPQNDLDFESDPLPEFEITGRVMARSWR